MWRWCSGPMAVASSASSSVIDATWRLRDPRVAPCLHQQGVDTSTPAGKALFQMMGVFAEFERAMIRERVKSAGQGARQDLGTTANRPSQGSGNP